MLPIYLREPSNEPARRRLAAALASRPASILQDRQRLAADRVRTRAQMDHLTARFAAALASRGIPVTHAPSAAVAADRVALLAAGTPVAVTRAAVLGELYPALVTRGVEPLSTYGPPLNVPFEARRQRFWQLPPHPPPTNWETQSVAACGANRRDVVGLLGVNAVSAETGAVYLVQHSHNISELLRAARLLVFVVGIDKIACDDMAAARQASAVALYGADSVCLDLARAQPVDDPLGRFPPAAGQPTLEVILLDNGRTALIDTRYQSLLTCIGCRACATRCPTYPAFRGPRGWNPKDYLWSHLRGDNPSLDLCTFCGNCEVDCPLDIPLPGLIALRRAEAIRARGRSTAAWRRRVQGDVQRVSEIFTSTAPLGNQVPRSPLAARVMENVFGLASERPLPTFCRTTFERWAASRGLRATSQDRPSAGTSARPACHGRPRVAYYFGCFANYNNPDVARATVGLLEHLGYNVALPTWRCCGIPLYAKGEMAAARSLAAANVAALAALVDAGHEIVTSCPSCQLALARDYPRLFPSAAAERVAAHTQFLSRFLLNVAPLDGALASLAGRAAYHLPCHLRALGMDGDSTALLAKVPGLHVSSIARGCCGLSGTFGFERDHYAQAMDAGNGLFAAIKDGDFDLVLTDCGACKLQIHHGSGRDAMHPIEILWRATRRMRPSVAVEPGLQPGAVVGAAGDAA